MKTSERGIALIRQFEGLELESYQDIAGVWTIGFGHTETAGPNQRISEREAEELLRRDLKPREKAVDDLANVSINQNEFDALVSFVYNVGIAAFRGSTARKRLNRGDRLGAGDALTWWNKATVNGVLREVKGLTRRRAAERGLFITPVNPPIVTDRERVNDNSRITPIEDSPRRTSLGESRTIQGATVAGGAGVAATTMGRESAEELDNIETEIEDGQGSASDHHVHNENDPSHEEASNNTSHNGHDEELVPNNNTTDSNPPETHESEITNSENTDSDITVPDSDTAEDTDPEFPPIEGSSTDSTIATTEVENLPPAKHEKHAADAQIQLALLIMIALSILYIFFARFDDWRNYRR